MISELRNFLIRKSWHSESGVAGHVFQPSMAKHMRPPHPPNRTQLLPEAVIHFSGSGLCCLVGDVNYQEGKEWSPKTILPPVRHMSLIVQNKKHKYNAFFAIKESLKSLKAKDHPRIGLGLLNSSHLAQQRIRQ